MGNTLSTLNCIHFEIMGDPCNLINTHRDRAFTHESHQLLLKRGKVSNQSDCRKMKDSFCNCLQTSSKLDQQDISTDQLVLYLSH